MNAHLYVRLELARQRQAELIHRANQYRIATIARQRDPRYLGHLTRKLSGRPLRSAPDPCGRMLSAYAIRPAPAAPPR